jgi:hypothetical protein
MSVIQEFTLEKFPFQYKNFITAIVDSDNKKIIEYFKFCYPEEDTNIIECKSTDWDDRIKIHKQFTNESGYFIFYGKDIDPFFYTVSDILVFTSNETLQRYIGNEYNLTFNSTKNFIVVYKRDKIPIFYTLDSTVFT